MSQMSASSIYTGFWINWSHGAILGATFTLNQRHGGLLTAFLAIFVSAAGASCWKITSYAIHQCRASQEYKDALHHQQQAILCNTESPAGALWDFCQLPWYWRDHARRSLARSIPLVLLALLNIATFGVAGIFSSDVTKAAGNETLIASSHCGYLAVANGNDSFEVPVASSSPDLNDTLAAATYSTACYGNTEDALGCNQYIRQQLHWTSNQNATCPFLPELCIYGSTAAYEMDTGLIDTHEHLGINAAPSDRVQYRKVTTCSPIHTRGYVTTFNDTDPTHLAYGDILLQYNYGPVVNVSNFTYFYDTHSVTDIEDYILTPFRSNAGYAGNDWIPVPALNRTDADVSIFFLAPSLVSYEAPVADPFFAASIPFNVSIDDGVNLTYYSSNQDVYALACTEQHQLCNPTNEKCTPLSGAFQLIPNLPGLDLNDAQAYTVLTMAMTISFINTYNSVISRGSKALRVSETLNQGFQIPLPDNQWMTGVSTWFAVSMAKLQQRTVQYATGPSYVPEGLTLVGPMNRYQENVCKNTKIRSQSGTTSFSVLGVSIILIVGSLLITISLVLSTVMGSIRQKRHWKAYKSLQWTLDDKLQLQRLAYEEAGQGHWSGGTESVPVTREGDKLGVPETVDYEHPRLSRVWEQSVSGGDVTPEAEGLIHQQQMSHGIDVVQS